MQVRSRIAPTPSGYLHAGNALNFILTWLLVRTNNGLLRLRIDDLDAPRIQPQFLNDVFETLEWLGLDWDEGPQSPDEHHRLFSQKLRSERYAQVLHLLTQTNRVFACQCSRKLVGAGQYPGTCIPLQLPLQRPETALRIQTPPSTVIAFTDELKGSVKMDLFETMRHFVIRRRDGIAAYQVASLADDMDYGINTIVRGEDLIVSTAAQLYLAQLAGFTAFSHIQLYHHALIRDQDGNKLSKSAGSQSLQWWRADAATPEKFYLYIGKLMGFAEPVTSLQNMLQQFNSGSSKVPGWFMQ